MCLIYFPDLAGGGVHCLIFFCKNNRIERRHKEIRTNTNISFIFYMYTLSLIGVRKIADSKTKFDINNSSLDEPSDQMCLSAGVRKTAHMVQHLQ